MQPDVKPVPRNFSEQKKQHSNVPSVSEQDEKVKDSEPNHVHKILRRVVSMPQRNNLPTYTTQDLKLPLATEQKQDNMSPNECLEAPQNDAHCKFENCIAKKEGLFVKRSKKTISNGKEDSKNNKSYKNWSTPVIKIFGKPVLRRSHFKPCLTIHCPPALKRIIFWCYDYFGFWTTFLLFFTLVFTSFYSISTEETFPPICSRIKSKSNPEANKDVVYCTQGRGITILFLYIIAFIFGEITEFMRLPGLLGMLLSGLLIRLTGNLITDSKILLEELPTGQIMNSEEVEKIESILIRFAAMCQVESNLSALLRRLALATILTRAGFSLDPRALKEGCTSVFRLAFMPCFGEAIGAILASKFIIKWDWTWGALLGFVLAAVSPAVIVPNMLRLEIDGWGVDKGIPTLIMAASSMDDVISIIGFGVAISICFTGGGDIVMTVCKGIGEAIGGAVVGAITGVLFWVLPPPGLEHCHLLRVLLTVLSSITCLVGAEKVHLSGAGALACLCFSFTVAAGWRAGYPWRLVTVVQESSVPAESNNGDVSNENNTKNSGLISILKNAQSYNRENLPQMNLEIPVEESENEKTIIEDNKFIPNTYSKSNSSRTVKLAYSVIPPHMRNPLKMEVGQGTSPSNLSPISMRKYFPITPRTRRFSLPEPRAHYDSEDFMKKTDSNHRSRLGSQPYAMQTMKSTIQVMNSVVGIDTRIGQVASVSGSRFPLENQGSNLTGGVSYHAPIPEVDSSSEEEKEVPSLASSSMKNSTDTAVQGVVFAEDDECVQEISQDEIEEEEGPSLEQENFEEVTPRDRGLECLKSIRMVYAALWWFLQPLLFVLIGSGVNIYEVFNKSIGSGVFALGVALIARLCSSVLAVTPSKLLFKERLFVAIAWLPKATVQAAIGSEALDRARLMKDTEPLKKQYIEWGEIVLSLAVISILITAPLGAILIPMTAPKLLKQTPRTYDLCEGGNTVKKRRTSTHEVH